MKDLAELNSTRARMRKADVDAIVVRVGDQAGLLTDNAG